tara:strand:+ start:246 stop:629 length:384 start_codon:yes stop_codon:yes gene_type:complete
VLPKPPLLLVFPDEAVPLELVLLVPPEVVPLPPVVPLELVVLPPAVLEPELEVLPELELPWLPLVELPPVPELGEPPELPCEIVICGATTAPTLDDINFVFAILASVTFGALVFGTVELPKLAFDEL